MKDFYSFLFGHNVCVAIDEDDSWKANPLVVKIKKHFGCKDDYFPDKSYEDIEKWLEKEVTLDTTNVRMCNDTAAEELQIQAVILLVKSGNPEAIDLANKFGEFLMTPRNQTPKGVDKEDKYGRDKKCVKLMAEAALMFRDIIQENNNGNK